MGKKKDKKLKKARAKATEAKATEPQVTLLPHVGTPAAQTWNYLHVNDIALEVPTPDAKGKVYEAVPRVFDAVETGVGADAARWAVAAAGDGTYVEVPRGTVREDPIVVSVTPDTSANTAVMVREGASATVVVVAVAGPTPKHAKKGEKGDELATSSALTRIIVERNAHVSLVEVVACDDATQHLEGVGIRADERASVEVRQYALGGAKTAFGIAVDLAGERSRLDLTMRYHASGKEKLDINHLCRQHGRHSHAEMHASGVLADAAQKTLRETIDLVHGAKDARGNEAETVLVTGDDAVNKTLPTILCDEEDVQGNHGATIGSVSPEQLAYLADRGLSAADAEALFVRAIFDDALINATAPEAHAAAVARAEVVLGAEVAHDLDEALTDEEA